MPQNTHSTDTPALLISLFPYLLKPGTSQNDPKPAKTTRNDPKRPKISQSTPKKLRNDSKRPTILKLGKYGIFHQFFFSNFWLKSQI